MTNVTSSGEIKMSSPVSRVLSGTVIHLGPASPHASSDLPESSAGRAIGFLFGLAPGGVYHRRELLPVTRCALTAPFHPYRCPRTCHGHLGGILSVALSVGSRRPGVTWHLALWSPDFPRHPQGMTRLSGRLRRAHCPTSAARQGRGCGTTVQACPTGSRRCSGHRRRSGAPG